MKRDYRIVAIGALALLVCAWAVLELMTPKTEVVQKPSEANVVPASRTPATPPPRPDPSIGQNRQADRRGISSEPATGSSMTKGAAPARTTGGLPTGPVTGSGKPPIEDLGARAALSLVGTDAEAEAYWISAINDPSLSSTERQDLIEDLNEDGLADPRGNDLQDLPLIASRVQLIEQLAPYAMDEVNADAFAEAYKDLVNLMERLSALARGGMADGQ